MSNHVCGGGGGEEGGGGAFHLQVGCMKCLQEDSWGWGCGWATMAELNDSTTLGWLGPGAAWEM